MNNSIFSALASGIGAMLGWGASDFFTKLATEKLHEFSILFWSQIIGALPLFVYLLLTGSPFNFDAGILPAVLLFAVFYGIAYALFFRGVSKGNVSVISPTLSAYGGFSVIISVLLFNEPLSAQTGLLLGLIFIGVILVSINWQDFKSGNHKKLLTAGIPETLISMIIFSFWYPVWDSFLLGKPDWVSPVIMLRTGMALSFLFIALFSGVKLLGPELRNGSRKLFMLLLCIGLADGIGFLAFNWGFAKTTETSVVNMIGSAYALPAVLLAAVFLKEKLNKTQIFGIALIIGSLIALNL